MIRQRSRFPALISFILPALLILAGNPARAQSDRTTDLDVEAGSTLAMVGAGILGGTIGFLVGGAGGIGISDCPQEDAWCGIEAAFLGGIAGESFLMPTGIHLANRRRGDYGRLLLTSSLIAAVGTGVAIGGAHLVDDASPLLLMPLIPVVQLLVCISQERHTGRKNIAARPVMTSGRRRAGGTVAGHDFHFSITPLPDRVLLTWRGSF